MQKWQIIFVEVDFYKRKEKTILDPQNRDDRVDLRVFGWVWAWIDVFMLISYQYSAFFMTDHQNSTFDKISYHNNFDKMTFFMKIDFLGSGFLENQIKNYLGPPKSIRENCF